MTKTNDTGKWFPEFMYEEDSKIPFVPVPPGEEMPSLLYFFESRETGEFEPGLDGNPLPIVQMDLHQFASMSVLKEKLPSQLFDEVRASLGLEDLKTAQGKGTATTAKIRNALT